MSEPQVPVRSCGGCGGCCKAFHIHELDKPNGQWCSHWRKGGGCGIYENRPRECREFSCLWLSGYGNEDERPDRTQLVLDLLRFEASGPFVAVRMTELRPGVLAGAFAKRESAIALARGYFVFRVTHAGDVSLLVRKGEPLSQAAQSLVNAGVKAFQTPVFVK